MFGKLYLHFLYTKKWTFWVLRSIIICYFSICWLIIDHVFYLLLILNLIIEEKISLTPQYLTAYYNNIIIYWWIRNSTCGKHMGIHAYLFWTGVRNKLAATCYFCGCFSIFLVKSFEFWSVLLLWLNIWVCHLHVYTYQYAPLHLHASVIRKDHDTLRWNPLNFNFGRDKNRFV